MAAKLRRISKEIVRRHGRKKGLFRHYLQLMRGRFGMFSAYQAIDWHQVKRLVFVCKGNICRSAYAEGRAKFPGNSSATSFGLDAAAGSPADRVAIQAAKIRGIELANHRTRPSKAVALGPGDLLVAMEADQAKVIEDWAKRSGAQVTLLGLWCVPPHPHLEDPFGLSADYFATCFELIDSALEQISLRMRRSLEPPQRQ